MAQKTDIRLRRSDTAGKIPTSANLSDGELAINTGSGALYFKKSDGTIITAHDNTILHIDSDTTGSSTTGTNPKVGIGTTSPSGNLHIKSVGNVGDALLIVEADADNNVESDNPRIELRQDNNLVSGALYLEGNAAATATNSLQNTLLLDAKGASADGGTIQFATGGLAANQSGGPTNSSVRMTILRDGNVGIGTTNPTQKLQVNGQTLLATNIFSASEATLRVRNGGNAGDIIDGQRWNGSAYESVLSVKNSGNVGIGTNSPSEVLHIYGSSNTVKTLIENTSTSTSAYATLGFQSDLGHSVNPGLFLTGSNNTNYAGANSLNMYQYGNLPLGFVTNNSLKMIIEGGGNVGIGTANPDKLLVVEGASAEIVINDTDTTDTPTLRFRESGSTSGIIQTDASNMIFKYGTTEAMRIDAAGNVGIGTTSPSVDLHIKPVTGNGNLYVERTSGALVFLQAQASAGAIGVGSNHRLDLKTNGTTRLSIAAGGAITFNTAFTFPTTDGTSGQVLKTNGSGTITWADETGGGSSSTSITDADLDTKIQVEESTDEDVIRFDVAGSEIATMTDDGVILNNGYNFEGDVVGAIKFKAQAGEALTKGDVVYISGISGNTTVVSKADANDSAKMPAFGLAASTVSLNAAVEIVTFGTLLGIDTSTPNYSEGDELFVSTTAGELTDTAPTGSGSLLQKIAKVTRVDASAGSVKVSGAGRTNATPNLDEGKIFVGNSSNQSVQGDDTLYVDMANSRVGINTTSPEQELHIASAANADVRLMGGNQTANYMDVFSGASSAGLWSTGSNPMQFATDGTERMRLDASGNVGIGTTSINAQARLHLASANTTKTALHIENTSTGGKRWDIAAIGSGVSGRVGNLQIRNDTAGANYIEIEHDTGNVGIGTSSPDNKLHVQGSAQLGDNNDSNGDLTFSIYSGLRQNTAGTSTLQLLAAHDTDASWGRAKLIVTSPTAASSALAFHTNVNAAATAERMRIHSNGNVGIGTTSPAYTLDVNGTAHIQGDIRISSIFPRIYLADSNNNSDFSIINANGNFGIYDDTNAAYRLQIDSSGNANFYQDVTVTGNLTVNGTTTTLNTATLDVEDKNITLNYSTGDSSGSANGAGITIQDAVDASTDATILWDATNDRFVFSNTLEVPTGQRIYFGDSSNMSIRWDTDAHFTNGSGDMFISNGADDKDIIFRCDDGSGGLSYYITLDGSEVLTKFSENTKHTDNTIAYFGEDNDLQIYHDGSNSYIADTGTGDLFIEADNNIRFRARASGETLAIFTSNGAVDLRHNNSTKLVTTSTGIDVTGTVVSDGLTVNLGSTGTVATFTGAASNRPFTLKNYDAGISGSGYIFDAESSFGAIKLQTTSVDRLTINNGGDISFYDDTGTTQGLFWDASAERLGIGTTSPSEKLDVVGNIKTTGTIYSGGSLRGSSGSATKLILDATSTTTELHAAGTTGIIFKNNGNNERMRLTDTGLGIGNTSPKAKLQVEEYGVDTTETSTTATTQVAIHTFAATDFRSARFTIQASNSTDSTYHISEILLVHDGTTPTITEYGTIFTGSAAEATFDADISSGNVRLLATPASTDSIEFKVICHSVTV